MTGWQMVRLWNWNVHECTIQKTTALLVVVWQSERDARLPRVTYTAPSIMIATQQHVLHLAETTEMSLDKKTKTHLNVTISHLSRFLSHYMLQTASRHRVTSTFDLSTSKFHHQLYVSCRIFLPTLNFSRRSVFELEAFMGWTNRRAAKLFTIRQEHNNVQGPALQQSPIDKISYFNKVVHILIKFSNSIYSGGSCQFYMNFVKTFCSLKDVTAWTIRCYFCSELTYCIPGVRLNAA